MAARKNTPATRPRLVDANTNGDSTWDQWDLDLEEFDAQMTEALGGAKGMRIRCGEDYSVFIPHPVCLNEERSAAVSAVESGTDVDQVDNENLRDILARVLDSEVFDTVWPIIAPQVRKPGDTIDGEQAPESYVRMAVAILGPEEHAKFLAHGGSSNRVNAAWRKLSEGMLDPKRRPSSNS